MTGGIPAAIALIIDAVYLTAWCCVRMFGGEQ